jgi:hypothetical protein
MKREAWVGAPMSLDIIKKWVEETFKEPHIRYTLSGDTIVVLSTDSEMGHEHDVVYECRVVAKWTKDDIAD